MGYRVERMRREESLIDLERVWTLLCRAHKLYRARIDVISILDSIIQLEEMLPKVKQQIMSKLAGSSVIKGSSQMTNGHMWSSHADSLGAAKLDDSVRKELENRGAELK